MYRLVNPIQSYAWGSRSAIAELLGEQVPSAEPQAELWLGAHPAAPSRVICDGAERSLVDMIDADPRGLLGADGLEAFGPRLPFLLKVLAVDQPLSLQAHPDADRAAAGFAEEQDRGIAHDDPRRTYRDPHHKPELICALTPFDALCGLRPIKEIQALLGELGVPELRLPGPGELAGLVCAILDAAAPGDLVAAVLAASRRRAEEGSPFAPSYLCAAELAERYPEDPGVVVSLLLNLIQLRPGQATYLPPGRLHAYLRGVGVEIMATSDNVLRGGLTPKHVDVPELMAVLEVRGGVPEILDGQPDEAGWSRYPTPAAGFALARAELDGSGPVTSEVRGPQILLCTDGALSLRGDGVPEPLGRGQSVFVPSGEPVAVTGTGGVYRATTGLSRG